MTCEARSVVLGISHFVEHRLLSPIFGADDRRFSLSVEGEQPLDGLALYFNPTTLVRLGFVTC